MSTAPAATAGMPCGVPRTEAAAADLVLREQIECLADLIEDAVAPGGISEHEYTRPGGWRERAQRTLEMVRAGETPGLLAALTWLASAHGKVSNSGRLPDVPAALENAVAVLNRATGRGWTAAAGSSASAEPADRSTGSFLQQQLRRYQAAQVLTQVRERDECAAGVAGRANTNAGKLGSATAQSNEDHE